MIIITKKASIYSNLRLEIFFKYVFKKKLPNVMFKYIFRKSSIYKFFFVH